MTDTSGEKDASPILANLIEQRRAFPTQAYMLIYSREDEIETILKEPLVEQIPQALKEKLNKENELLQEMKKDQEDNEECEPVFVITPEIV